MRRMLALALVAGTSTACIGFAGLGDGPDLYARKPTSLDDAGTNADGSDSGSPDGASADAASADASVAELGARTASLTGDGLGNCGPNGDDNCARSLLIAGGTFYRGTDTNSPATISDFRLDKYEVTVGRFRKFVDGWLGGWRPPLASGKHAHLNSGKGLTNTTGGNEQGWDETSTTYVGAPSNGAVEPTGTGAATRAAWDTNLNCGSSATWTSSVGANEKRPMTCLSWYDLYAFCIWDGGFLPSEAEWEYATAGGSNEWLYAWGNTEPGANASLAIYGGYYNGNGASSGLLNIAPVGTVAAGAGRWGHLDLAGNVFEWTLDWRQSLFAPSCSDCTQLTPSSHRVVRGGSYCVGASYLQAAFRGYSFPAIRSEDYGGRCARTP